MAPPRKSVLLARELALLSPEVRRSAERLNELLADDFVEFGSSGRIFDRKSVVSSLAGSDEPEFFEVRDFRLVDSDQRHALAVYACDARTESGELLRTSNRSSYWVLRNGQWQMLFHQGTRSE